MTLTWTCLAFERLSAAELYRILQRRNEVFVVEQHCVFQDADGKDPLAWHLCGWQEAELLAYARLLAPGDYYPEAAIGRVLSAPSHRGRGLGRALMQEALSRCRSLFGPGPLRIGAQQHLSAFYGSLGFLADGVPYLEDGIPHIEMLLNLY